MRCCILRFELHCLRVAPPPLNSFLLIVVQSYQIQKNSKKVSNNFFLRLCFLKLSTFYNFLLPNLWKKNCIKKRHSRWIYTSFFQFPRSSIFSPSHCIACVALHINFFFGFPSSFPFPFPFRPRFSLHLSGMTGSLCCWQVSLMLHLLRFPFPHASPSPPWPPYTRLQIFNLQWKREKKTEKKDKKKKKNS